MHIVHLAYWFYCHSLRTKLFKLHCFFIEVELNSKIIQDLKNNIASSSEFILFFSREYIMFFLK
jgi:hypothetical protein